MIKYELIGMNKMKSFEEVFEDKTKYGTKIKTNEYQQEGKYLIVDQGQEQVAGYTNLEEGVFEEVPAIVFGDHTRVIKYVEEPFFLGADGVKVLKCRLPNANYKYLYYTLLNAKIPNTGYNRHFKWLKEIKIAYPNTEKQTEIVCILDKVSKIIGFRQRQLKKLDELVKSRFIEMFVTDKNVCNWSQVRISDVSTDMRTGPFGSALHHDEFVDSGVFVLGIDNAVENRFSYNRMRYITEEKYNQLKRYTVYPGDLIITIMGTVGRSAVIPQDMPKAISTKHLACITPDSAVVDPCFLSSAFQMHPAIRLQLQNQCKGAIMDGLNLTIIKELRFQLPPIDQQKQFSEFVEQTDKSKFVIQQALDKAQLLFDSLMQKYFG